MNTIPVRFQKAVSFGCRLRAGVSSALGHRGDAGPLRPPAPANTKPERNLGRRVITSWFGFIIVLACSLQVYAQPTSDARVGEFAPRLRPPSTPVLWFHPRQHPSLWDSRNLTQWPRLDRAALRREDAQTAGVPGLPLRIGVNRPAPQGNIGMWQARRTRHSSGRQVWTYQLEAAGALAVRVHFSRCDLPAGAELVIAGTSNDSGESYVGNGQEEIEAFWSAPIPGDVVYLEYRSAPDDSIPPSIEIDEVSHVYRDPLPAGATPQNDPDPQPQDHVLTCQVDVNCLDVPPVVRDAIGRMVFTTSQGTFTCTGTLLADLDPNTSAGYFLTANHCISTPAAAASLAVYWFYQTDACNGVAPPLANLPRSNGSTLLATSPESDFTLLRLRDDPNAGQGFVEWTTNAPVGQVVSIHHPRGEYKRISIGALTSEQPICGSFPTNRFWYLDWVMGITETGSSGGPLFDSNWRVIGQLFGTCSFSTPTCSNPQDYNVAFGRFALTYPLIASYLESIIPDDAYEDNDTPAQAAPINPGTNALRLVDFNDYFVLTLAASAEITATAVFSTAEMNLDLALLSATGQVLSLSAGASGTETVSATLPAGTYHLHASRTNRWGGNYTLVVAVDPGSAVSQAPSITNQPDDLLVNQGQNATFTVQASGTPPLFYRWYFNDTNAIAGATNSSLLITNAQDVNAGSYSIIVSNGMAVASSNALLVINHLPAPASPNVERFYGQGFKVSKTALLGNDPDGDVLSLSAVNAFSALGASVTTNAGWVFYTPGVGLTNQDSFGYLVGDGRGGFSAGLVTVLLTTNPAASLNLFWGNPTNGAVLVTGSGIPGRTYTIEFTETVNPPDWQIANTVAANPFGLFQYTNQPPAGSPKRFYRARTPQ